jgi:hypothetical protein
VPALLHLSSSLAHNHERVELSQAPDRTYGVTPVLASLRGNKSIAELCREHDIADSLLR